MQIETEKSTEYLLEQWVRWSLSQADRLSFPHMAPYARAPRLGCSADIGDDEAMMIDSIVARLLKRDREMGNVTLDYYFGGCNISAIARRYRISRARVDVLVRAGTAWVDATRMARLESA